MTDERYEVDRDAERESDASDWRAELAAAREAIGRSKVPSGAPLIRRPPR